MKIKAAVLIGLLVLNGSAYAMVVNGMPIPMPLFKSQIKEQIKISKVYVHSQTDQMTPAKPSKIHSKLDNLILEYQVNCALGASS